MLKIFPFTRRRLYMCRMDYAYFTDKGDREHNEDYIGFSEAGDKKYLSWLMAWEVTVKVR